MCCEVAFDLTFICSMKNPTQVAAQPDNPSGSEPPDDDDKPPPAPPKALTESQQIIAEQDRLRKQQRLLNQCDKLSRQAAAIWNPGDPEPNPDSDIRNAEYQARFENCIHMYRRQYAPSTGHGTMEAPANHADLPPAANATAGLEEQLVADTETPTEQVQAWQAAEAQGHPWPILPPHELQRQAKFQIWQGSEATANLSHHFQIPWSEAEMLRQSRERLMAAQGASPQQAQDMQEGVWDWESWEAEGVVSFTPYGQPQEGACETASVAASAAPLAPVAPGEAETAPVASDAASDAATCATDDAGDDSWQPNDKEPSHWQPTGVASNASAPNANASQWTAPLAEERQRQPFNAFIGRWICLDSNDYNTIFRIRMSTLECCMHAKCIPMV